MIIIVVKVKLKFWEFYFLQHKLIEDFDNDLIGKKIFPIKQITNERKFYKTVNNFIINYFALLIKLPNF